MMTVSRLFIYPVKSLGGIEKESVYLGNTGFRYDRHWMLVDENNSFISQRQIPAMALLQTAETNEGFLVYDARNISDQILIPFESAGNKRSQVTIWDDICEAAEVSDLHNEWFSDRLKQKCRLVFLPDNFRRSVDQKYTSGKEITAFSDGYPLLMISQPSLDLLNQKLSEPLPVNRFRPNLVFTGGHPHIEDEMEVFQINEIHFHGVKLCARCVITTIDQNNAAKGIEPLNTLSKYRKQNNKICFGQNVVHQQCGNISVGDRISILKTKEPLFT